MITESSRLQTASYEEYGAKELLFTHDISDEEMMRILTCSGFSEHFNASTFSMHDNTREILNAETQAFQLITTGVITAQDGEVFEVVSTRDLDNRGMKVRTIPKEEEQSTPAIYVNIRDRAHDGTPASSSPYYLQALSGLAQSAIPDRSYYVGGTNWDYSTQHDRVALHVRAAEISIISSDPKSSLLAKFQREQNQLLPGIQAHDLATFVDDPFAALPSFDSLSKEKLTDWYRHFWEIMERGFNGQTIPIPGQTSESGFPGFFLHVIKQMEASLKQQGYDRLDAIPTWPYVRRLFTREQFVPTDQARHTQADAFDEATSHILLPTKARDTFHAITLGDMTQTKQEQRQQKALAAWYQVLPFALLVHAEHFSGYSPQLGGSAAQQAQFEETIFYAMEQYVTNDRDVKTYPFVPGMNLWYTRQID